MTTKQQIQLEYDRKRITLKEELKRATSDRDFNRREANDEMVSVYREERKITNELHKKRSKELTDLKIKHAEGYTLSNEVNRHLLSVKYGKEKRVICMRYDDELREVWKRRDDRICKIRKELRNQETFYEEQIEDIKQRLAEADAQYIHQMEQLEMYGNEIQDAEEV